MLKSVDILIGFSVIMLVVSMSVTLIIQWIVHISRMRGKELLKGLTALLQQIDPGLEKHAEEIATQILTNPMLARGAKFAAVVHREELIKTVLEIAASAAPQAAQAAQGTNPPDLTDEQKKQAAIQALATALGNLGIPDPGKKLDAIRLLSMRLEASQPELATHVREAQAVITEAESQFVAKINGWFDPAMDRVSQSFTKRSHYWTAGISLFLALLLQIDAFKIINRLSIDDALRSNLVNQAAGLSGPSGASGATSATASTGTTGTTGPTGEPTEADLRAATKKNLAQLTVLATDKLITWPTWPSGKTGMEGLSQFWNTWSAGWSQSSVFGVLLSAALLSLGAPFWFNVLGGLLKLRPVLAAKDDQQRKDRESSQPPADGGGSTPSPLAARAPAPASGERGDLSAG